MSDPGKSSEEALKELALDVSIAPSRAADALWRQLNPQLWEQTDNPWAVLQTVSKERLKRLIAEPAFRATLDELLRARLVEKQLPRWFQQKHKDAPLTGVAYFSMEFMLSEALPIYSGGLGNVAGDQLKAASDLGVPVIGVGLLYSQGYFRQELDRYGSQRALYPFNDPGQLPVTPVRGEDGDWLRLTIPFPGIDLWVRVWEVQVGQAKLYLLDTNDPANIPEYRGITSELYGGGPDLRLRQEHVLGIGGWRLLRALSIHPEVCHLNEGHAAFAVLERAASYKDDTGKSFETALAITRAGNLFTTHTAVEAGFDRFPVDLMRPHFERYCSERLGIGFDELMGLGRRNPEDSTEPFNMAYLAIRGSGAVNGVSRLHGVVSRALFEPLFPRWPAERSARRPRYQRRPCFDLGFRRSVPTLEGRLRARLLGREPGDHGSPSFQHRRRAALEHADGGAEIDDRIPAAALRKAGRDPRRIERGDRRGWHGFWTPTPSPSASRGVSPHTNAPTWCCTIPAGSRESSATHSGPCNWSSPAKRIRRMEPDRK